jgi:flagellar assembly protein FliH
MGKILKGDDFKKRMDLKTKVQFEDRVDVFDDSESSVVVSKDVLDAQSKARSILEEAKLEASQIKKEAKELLDQVKDEMEKSRKKGEEWGYQDGQAKALEFLNKIHLLKEKMFQNIEPQVVKLVFAISEKVIGRQMKENDQAILGVVKQALDSAIGNKIVVKVHPSDFEKLKAQENELLSKVEATKTISFKEDEAVKAGGCMVESEVGTVDAQLDTQLSAIKKALGL